MIFFLRPVLCATVFCSLQGQVNVLTYQYDISRAGANTGETTLKRSNVNSTQFGKLFSNPVDGHVYAQPLYTAGVNIAGQGVHNVVFVATEHDSVYAFDADSNSLPLWHVNFLNGTGVTTMPAGETGCNQIVPEIGITGTPVIDPAAGTLYVVAVTREPGGVFHRLHALDITSGAERPGSPVAIQPSIRGTGDGGSTVTFNPKNYKQRPGLLLLNGVVYIGMSSHCDIGVYHGWLIGYDAQTLRQTSVYNTTPNGVMGSLWAGGAAPAADSAGNIYVVSGNGSFDFMNGGSNLGESYIKLSSATGLAVSDYFTPFNFAFLNDGDLDVGSAGVALLPDEVGSAAHPHLMISAGKEGRVYIIDRDNPGKWQSGSDSQIVNSYDRTVFSVFGNPAYFNRTVYFCGAGDNLRAFPISDGALGSVTTTAATFSYPGCVPSVSANGTSDGILWLLENSGTLRAYDSSNVTNELYNSNQNASRDALGAYVKFSVPAIANGKVYAGTQTSLAVYGLINAPGSIRVSNAASGQPNIAAPGSIIAIKGLGLAQSTASAPSFPLPLTLSGATVDIGGAAAPILFASPAQINAQVPFEARPGSVAVQVSSGGTVVGTANVIIQNAAPGIFFPGVVNADGTINPTSSPATTGSIVSVYATGLGAVDNPVPTGAAAPASPLSQVPGTTATIGGRPAQVLFAGLAPGFAGLYQINVLVPQLTPGDYAVQILVGGAASNFVPMSIR